MNKKAFIIKATNPKLFEVRTLETPFLKPLQEIVGGYIDIVRPYGLPRKFMMIIDEEGALKTNLAVNLIPSLMYGGPIFGDVVFMRDGYDDAGEPDIVGLTVDEIEELVSFIRNVVGVTDMQMVGGAQ